MGPKAVGVIVNIIGSGIIFKDYIAEIAFVILTLMAINKCLVFGSVYAADIGQ